ncbi:hypothetical protein V8F20_002874, partial [Naviculisporaceae sp. PSN 640]
STCLITLGLCVWTAVHLNIPGRYEKRIDTFRKIGWTILGFLTPEVVAFTAYRQYKEAVTLSNKLQQIFPSQDIENGTGVTRPWTLTHSFFVVMGGVEVALEEQSVNIFPRRSLRGEHRDSLILTTAGFRLLAEKHPHLVQGLSLQMIQDKSKGGVFAKTLVCLQALWFCVQCLTRLGQHLGISLLELNTFGHLVCALGIYILWWHKPLDIQEPLTIYIPPGPEAEILAIMCMTSILDAREPEIASVYPRLKFESSTYDCPNLQLGVSTCIISPRTVHEYQADIDTYSPWQMRLRIEAHPHFWARSPDPDSWMIDLVIPLPLRGGSDGETQHEHHRLSFIPPLETTTIPRPLLGPDKNNKGKLQTVAEVCTIEIPHGSLHRYALAAKHVDEWTELSDPDHNPHHKPRPGYENTITDRIPNLPRLQPIRKDWMFYFGFGVVGFLYGGLHCLAWNAPFNTRAEQFLWRVSSVVLTATGILLVHLYTWELSRPVIGFGQRLGDLGKNLRRFHKSFLYTHLPDWLYSRPLEPPGHRDRGISSWEQVDSFRYVQKWDATALVILPIVALLTIARVAYDLLVCFFIVVYITARVFLVVECFINLTHLPESAYLLPQWSQYVLHIG